MIYEVYIDGELLYYPNDEAHAIINSKLETALNEAGTFECYVPKNNVLYDGLNSLIRSGMLTVLKDGTEIFNGEIREVKQCFDFTKQIYAVGELAFLFDSIQPQARYQTTPTQMFTQMIATHNSQVENRKKFTVGNVLVTDPNDYVYRYTNYEDTLSAIRDKLCDKLDGFLKIRKVGNTRYLDLVPLENYGRYCSQEIQFGENLMDYSCNYNAEDIATAVIPLGAKLDDEARTSAQVEGLDEYLTIKSVNNNLDYLVNNTAAARFGYVRVVKHWDDVTVAENLKTKGQDWLTSAQYSKMELELNAVDLNLLDTNIESFEVGDTVHCWAEPYGMDTTFPVRKKTVYLNDLSKNFIVLSNTETAKSYTKQASKAVETLKEEIPQTSPLLEEARKKALAMILNSASDGYVVDEFAYDSEGYPLYKIATNYCNAPTIEASTRRWRFGVTGLGFLERANINVPWPDSNVPIALLPDGSINADRILTGTLNANTVRVWGKIEATSGYFGADASTGWNVGSKYINSQNGPTSVLNETTEGTYVGTDGIVNNYGSKSARITSGEIRTTGLLLGGNIASTGYVNGTNITASNNVKAHYYKTTQDGLEKDGATGQVTIVVNGHTYVIQATHGIITYIGSN